MSNENLVVARFRIHSSQNHGKSKAAGRPIFDDIEVCELRFAGNKQTVGVFPAHEVFRRVPGPDGVMEPVTYAMQYSDEYKKFKAGEIQTSSGTPLSELPFLSQAKRLELKALNIHTAEALAMLDGQPLKMLGMNGRELKDQAVAYLSNAAGSADVTALAAENAELKSAVAELQRQFQTLASQPVEDTSGSAFSDWDDTDIKNWIADKTGTKPKGNPSHATLVRMADELNVSEEAA